MELINENDLQNVYGGMQRDTKDAATAAGLLLLVCGLAILSVCDDDFRTKIEDIVRPEPKVIIHDCTTYCY